MVTYTDLVSSFSSSCEPKFNKDVGKWFGTANKKIKDFQTFFVKKKYRKSHPDATDRSRYDDMMSTLVATLSEVDEFQKYLVLPSEYFAGLSLAFCSDDGFEQFQANFKKGSYKALAQQLNRVFNPKNKNPSDVLDSVTELKSFIKPFAEEFDAQLRTFTDTHKFYTYTTTTSDPNVDLHQLAVRMYNDGVRMFGVMQEPDDSASDKVTCTSFFVTDSVLGQDGFSEVTVDDFLTSVCKEKYVLNPLHYTNMDTLKRDFMSKNKEMFNVHADVFGSTTKLYYYTAHYNHADDYNRLNDDTISNGMGGLVQAFSDYSKKTLAVFVFNGEIGNVSVDSYWLTTQSSDEMMSEFDHSAFTWKDSTFVEFTDNMATDGTLGTVVLH
jgi:hypothetical protein